MWQPFMPVLLLLLHMKGYMSMTDCTWVAVVNDFEHLGGDRNIFFKQHKILEVTQVFQELVDSAIDPKDKDYLGFPYYLKINLTCRNLVREDLPVLSHYSGLRPIVTVTFQEPVHSVRQKQEQLQIKMLAAPFRFPGCESEVVCRMAWYTPMPFMNGSVVMNVLVESNGLGLPMESKRFSININGYAEAIQNAVVFTIGEKLKTLKDFVSLRDPSRPLWHTHQRAPVLILGGVPENKIVFLSDTEFEDFFAIEVGIDSCWIGSLSCPQKAFSSSISDTIATESTLFIRQNQLVYYFTGHYPILYMNSSGSGMSLWTRILNNVCVKKLNPVFFAKNDTEYVIALGGGWQDGHFFLLTVRGIFPLLGPKHLAVCLLPIPDLGQPLRFVMLLGLEHYTNTALTPRGLALNPSSKMFYVWGNVILQSNDMVSYIYLSNFPSNSPIKYFVLSFTGRIAFVTDQEEVRLLTFPQIQRPLVSRGRSSPDETPGGFPWDRPRGLLAHVACLLPCSGQNYIRFTHRCPFAVHRLVDLPLTQRFSRMEHYRANPPEIMEKTGFHDKRSLTVYQGLIYQLLQLHSSYHRSYADPVHDPTWRWWKNKKQDAEYYSYMASNWKSSGGMYVDMANYVKIYNLKPNNMLPESIYLDKKTAFTFNVYLSIRTSKQSSKQWEPRRHCSEEGGVDPGSFIRTFVTLPFPLLIRDPRWLTCSASISFHPHNDSGNSMVQINIGCPPGKRLAFDITYTKNYTAEKNKRYFDCVASDPEMPCFYFSDVFYPFFLIQDMVTGDSGRFNGSYIFSIIGGGPFNLQNIKYFTPEEILRYNTSEKKSLSSHRWVCQYNSPCYDIIPDDMSAPDYYFVVKVSNRGVDQTTYCDYALEFIVHIHGLRLSATRSLYFLKVTPAVPRLPLSFAPQGPTLLGCFCLKYLGLLSKSRSPSAGRAGAPRLPAPSLSRHGSCGCSRKLPRGKKPTLTLSDPSEGSPHQLGLFHQVPFCLK
uniref:Cation channel sperm associated auxiliary subunit gamma n=1 Tax=Varanus komodoensis TaxID=61221 RepID=A0A8D2L9Y7_VARKO